MAWLSCLEGDLVKSSLEESLWTRLVRPLREAAWGIRYFWALCSIIGFVGLTDSLDGFQVGRILTMAVYSVGACGLVLVPLQLVSNIFGSRS